MTPEQYFDVLTAPVDPTYIDGDALHGWNDEPRVIKAAVHPASDSGERHGVVRWCMKCPIPTPHDRGLVYCTCDPA